MPFSRSEFPLKIRIVKSADSVVAYAIGLNVYKLTTLSTGIKESVENGVLNIYPNPNSRKDIFIETDVAGTFTVEVTDINGKTFFPVVTRIDGKTLKADMKDYAPGLYIIMLRMKDRTYTEKVILGTIRP